MSSSSNRGGRGRGRGGGGRGRGKGQQDQRGSNGKVRLLGSAQDKSFGQEKTVDIRVTNADGEGYLGQALHRLLMDKDSRKLLHAMAKAKFPDVIEHGDQHANSSVFGAQQSQILQMIASAVGGPGAAAASTPSVPTSTATPDFTALLQQLQQASSKTTPQLSSSSTPSASSAPSGMTVCQLPLDTVATLAQSGQISATDYPAWCTAGGFTLVKLYGRMAAMTNRRMAETPRGINPLRTPGSTVRWQSLTSPASESAAASGGSHAPAPSSATSYRSAPDSAFSLKSTVDFNDLLGINYAEIKSKSDEAKRTQSMHDNRLNTVISSLFILPGGGGVDIDTVTAYVNKWHAELELSGVLADYLRALKQSPGSKEFLAVLSACGQNILKRKPDCLRTSTPASTAAAKRKPGGIRKGNPSASRRKTGSGGRQVAKELDSAAGEGHESPTLDLTKRGRGNSSSSTSTAQLESLQSMVQRAAPTGNEEVRVQRSALCDCMSLTDFPTHALSLHTTSFNLSIPCSDMTYVPSPHESQCARGLMHLLDIAIASGSLQLQLVVKYTRICIKGSSHILTHTPLDRQPTCHGCSYPFSVSPFHLHRWYRILSDIVFDLINTHGPTDSRVMCICTIKTRVSLCILLYSAKRCHARSCECVDSLLMYMHTFGGTILNRLPRNIPINAIYVKFSVYHGYCYIGETSTTNRFYDHMRMMSTPTNRLQRVHIVMGRLGTHLHDTLIVNFNESFDRLAFETALIRKHCPMNKYLLNVRQRYGSVHDSKSLQLKRTLHIQRDRVAPLNKRQRLLVTSAFIRPYISTRTPTPSIQPSSIPCIVLFGGGIGGVTDGLLRTGKYDIRVVYEYDTHACTSHRKRFPSIPVVQYTLGGDINYFISSLVRYLPRRIWSASVIQASPPCRDLSRANLNEIHRDDAMRLVEWTFALIDVICPAAYMIENVPKMVDCLSYTDAHHRHSHVFDLAYYVPQRRMRAMITNFPLEAYITPLSTTPLPAKNVLLLQKN